MASQLQKPLHYDQHEHIDHAPLAEAVCQISYSPILKINDGIDSKIQDLLPDWPQYEQLMDPVLIENMNNVPSGQFISCHQFSNTDTLERITIRNHSLGFATDSYNGWDDFFEKLQRIYNAFRSCYEPAALTRIGLRYTNFIYCDYFSVESGKTISDFINDPFAGPISGYAKSDSFIRSYQGDLTVNNDNKTSTHIVYGLVTRLLDNRPAFLVDIDVSCNHKQPLNYVLSDLNIFHEYAYDAFRWVVKDVPGNCN